MNKAATILLAILLCVSCVACARAPMPAPQPEPLPSSEAPQSSAPSSEAPQSSAPSSEAPQSSAPSSEAPQKPATPASGGRLDGSAPISPWDYQKLLGTGFDVNWERHDESRKKKMFYSERAVRDFQKLGVSHVRIRLHDKMTSERFALLDRQLDDCLQNGIIPIIAYAADDFKANPSAKTIRSEAAWWKAMVEHCASRSYLVSFNLLIECSEAANEQPELLNELYEACVTAIRETNPERIVIISPRMTSSPYYLKELKIPTQHGGYLMGEWHFYASGPTRRDSDKQWTTGTATEKAYVTDKIAAAVAWQKSTGIPTWVGAWMPGNYNKKDEYTVPEQIAFAEFLLSELRKSGIPSAVNADTHFYDHAANAWLPAFKPLMKAIFS